MAMVGDNLMGGKRYKEPPCTVARDTEQNKLLKKKKMQSKKCSEINFYKKKGVDLIENKRARVCKDHGTDRARSSRWA